MVPSLKWKSATTAIVMASATSGDTSHSMSETCGVGSWGSDGVSGAETRSTLHSDGADPRMR